MRTRVKICGVRSVEDALLAARAGADAVGLIQVAGARRRISVELAAEIAAVLPAYVTPVLVGGLTVENVGDVVRQFRPFAVDTSSGVENPAEPGKKEPRRVEAFVGAVHAADCEREAR